MLDLGPILEVKPDDLDPLGPGISPVEEAVGPVAGEALGLDDPGVDDDLLVDLALLGLVDDRAADDLGLDLRPADLVVREQKVQSGRVV